MQRNFAIDFIKGIGLFLIAALHLNLFGGYDRSANWLVNTGVRFAVPFFFLASGYFLFQKLRGSENKTVVFKNYIFRVLKYYFIGLFVCFAFDYFILMPLWEMPRVFFRGYVSGNFWSDFLYYGLVHMSGFHLWFLLAMFWSGLILFLVCCGDLSRVKPLAAVAFLLHVIGLFGMTQPYSQFVEIPLFPRDAAFYGLFYMSLGGVWAMGGLPGKYIPGKYALSAVFVFFLLQLAERSALVFGMGAPQGRYWGEYFVMTIPLTAALFRYALENGEKFKNNVVTKIGSKSVGVYILHLIALNITYSLLHFAGWDLQRHPFWQVVQVLAVIFLSYVFYLAFLKIYAAAGRIPSGCRRLRKSLLKVFQGSV